tara:strand:+ start:334 stop:579 length:246 start_codon:yes stop_codon:yes gene_type:complete
MAITKTQLKTIKFTQIRDSSDLIRPVGDDLMLTATGSHIYLNGMHLINTEFMDLKWLDGYLEKVIQGKRKHDKNSRAKREA